jgi:hypothetical protein
MGRGMKILDQMREAVVAPAIDAIQRNPVTVLALNALDTARAISNSPGAAPLHAMVRQGADEIAQVLTAFPAHAVQPVAEQGQIFEPTPQLVTEQMTGKLGLDDLRGIARESAAKANKEMERPSKDRGIEM